MPIKVKPIRVVGPSTVNASITAVRSQSTAQVLPLTINPVQFGFSEPRLPGLSNVEQQTWLADMKSMGMKWIRFDLEWARIQPSNSSSFTWTYYDTAVANCKAAGFKVLGMMAYTPSWARPSGCTELRCGPADLNTYANFAKNCVQHFGANIDAYEIWNEPNIDFWLPAPDPVRYVQMLKLSADAMRIINPNVVILPGGTSPAATSPGGDYSPIDWITSLYAHGAKDYFTAIAHHPYSYPATPSEVQPWSGWSQMSQTSPSIRSVMIANGDANKKIWMTEVGAATNGPGAIRTCSDPLGGQADFDECMQARELQQVVSISKTLPWAGPVLVYTYKDIGTSTTTRENFFGVLRFDGSQKQSYMDTKTAIATR